MFDFIFDNDKLDILLNRFVKDIELSVRTSSTWRYANYIELGICKLIVKH